jgi:DNA-binding CsgD family transcriptional regulator
LIVLSVPLEPDSSAALTSAQLDVARAIAQGATNADIARARGTSVRTVANQVASILRGLGVDSRAQVAARLALVDFSPSPSEDKASTPGRSSGDQASSSVAIGRDDVRQDELWDAALREVLGLPEQQIDCVRRRVWELRLKKV